MCTVTWCTNREGIDLIFSRDERRDRPSPEPPQIYTERRTSFIAARDPQSKGTWLGINAFGLTVGIVNYYLEGDRLPDPLSNRPSRGLLVWEMLSLATLSEISNHVNKWQPERYPSFRFFCSGRTRGWVVVDLG